MLHGVCCTVHVQTYMFNDASAFNEPIGSWNVARVADMSTMFDSASAFNQSISGVAWRHTNSE